MKSKKFSQFGFGILEVLIASAIISMVATASLILGTFVLRSANINKHRLQASYLASEAVESVRNFRDNLWMDNNNVTTWDNSIRNINTDQNVRVECDETSGCQIIENSEPQCFDINLSPINCTDENQVFEREVKINNVNLVDSKINNKTKEAVVTVTWTDYSRSRTFEVKTYITDWMSY